MVFAGELFVIPSKRGYPLIYPGLPLLGIADASDTNSTAKPYSIAISFEQTLFSTFSKIKSTFTSVIWPSLS